MRNGRSIKRPVRLERVVSDASRGDQKAQYAGDPDTGDPYSLHWLATGRTVEFEVVQRGRAQADTAAVGHDLPPD